MSDTNNEELLAREALDRMASSLMAAMNDRAGREQVQRDHALVGAALSFRPPVPAECGSRPTVTDVED